MGMYSTFVGEDIEVIHKIFFIPVFSPVAGIGPGNLESLNPISVINDNGKPKAMVGFEAWDDIKLEGYWFESEIVLLNYIKHFIQGLAEFGYEEGYNFQLLFNGKGDAHVRREERYWSDKTQEIQDI